MFGHARTASREFAISEVTLAVPVTLGTVRLPVDAVTFPSPGPVGAVGSAALAGMSITIDQRNRLLRIEPGAR